MEITRIRMENTMPASIPAGMRKQSENGIPTETSRNRDTVKLSYSHIETIREGGYLEVGGERINLDEKTRNAILNAYAMVQAKNQARELRNQMIQANESAKQQAKMLDSQNKAMRQAMKIYHRIAKGGRVPPEDEEFLLEYAPEMYLSAKMAALAAKKHEKYDSALEKEEETSDGAGPELDMSTDSLSVDIGGEISGGETVSADV